MAYAGADVYSYAPDEDDMVTDPHLDKHLRHWGINMMQVREGKGVGMTVALLTPTVTNYRSTHTFHADGEDREDDGRAAGGPEHALRV